MTDLVSIIVPVYNVEAYIERCIRSIVKQTYKNIEVILVNDGSTDNSGNLCNKWSNIDSRIKLVNKMNGGLSDARNWGLEKATGSFVLFIDSDDWIHEDMLMNLMKAIIRHGADIACCGLIEARDNLTNNLPWFHDEMLLTRNEALDYLIDNTLLTSHVVTKLYRRSILKYNIFPKGIIYEDLYIMHKIFNKCKKIAIVPECLYYYYCRPDSISRSVSLKNRLAWIKALEKRLNDIGTIRQEYNEKLLYQIANVYSLTIVQNRFTSNELKAEKKRINELQIFLKREDVKLAVKKYGTRKQYYIYLLAKIFSTHISSVYRIVKGGT